MRRVLFASICLVALVAGVPAQKAQPAAGAENSLRMYVEYLASDKLAGRRTGEAGATAAASYIQSVFRTAKLKPGMGRDYLQPFPYVSGVVKGTGNLLVLTSKDPSGTKKMVTGENWLPSGYSPNADIPNAPIVFAGYGIHSNELKYDDYAGLDAKGKILLILDGTPDAGNPHSEFGRFNLHVKASIAKEHGARALLVIGSEKEFQNDHLSRLSYDQTFGELALPAAGISRGEGAELLGLDDPRSIAEFEKWNAARPADAKITVRNPIDATARLRIDLKKKKASAFNVIGILPGSDPALKGEAIIIGAHYDHLGHGGQGSLDVNSSAIHHGADDNASGTSAVLELASEFAKRGDNKRTIIFMAFSGEEEGLIGSKYYVNNPVWPLNKTVAMINLDMVGRLNNQKLNVGGIGTATEWKALVEGKNGLRDPAMSPVKFQPSVIPVSNGKIGWPVEPFSLALNEDGFGPSDHSSFYGKQIPVLFFFTGTHVDYHKPSDTAEKINYQGLARITNYVADIVYTIDRDPRRPTYTTAKSSGIAGRSTGFSVSLGTVPSYADSTDGLVLDGVRDGSPAAKAGIRPGDKIVKLAGKEVRNVMDYTYILGELKAGEEYEVELIRDGGRQTLKIIPAPAARR